MSASADPDTGGAAEHGTGRLLAEARRAERSVQVAGSRTAELAENLLATLGAEVDYDRAAVFTGSADDPGKDLGPGGGALHLLAARPAGAGWDLDLGSTAALGAAWAAGAPRTGATQHRRRGAPDQPGSALALPLGGGPRPLALVALETNRPQAYPSAVISAAREGVTGLSAQLELALLLDEVRVRAAAEERRWLAREIHDGISQDLAALGYALDEVLASGLPDQHRAGLADVRRHLTELLRDLRGTLGGLRAGVPVGSDLPAALAEAARRLAERSGWTLHLDLQSTGERLPPIVEVELFRIGQEALINVAKHASAGNVWLSCHQATPSALVTVVDDGIGGRENRPRPDSYGFVTMSERALRLGASLCVRERRPTGTSVEVRLGGSGGPRGAAGTANRREQDHDDRDSVQAEQEADSGSTR